LAPSQHIRLTRGRTRTGGSSRLAISAQLLTLLLGATLALSACGAQQAGAAAIVNGTAISDKDVQTVSLQLNSIAQGQQPLTPSIVLVNMILAPYVLAEAERTGKGVPDAQARKVIAKLANPSRPTLDFVHVRFRPDAAGDPGPQPSQQDVHPDQAQQGQDHRQPALRHF